MKKQYEAPELTSLKYAFTESIAATGDIEVPISGLLPPGFGEP